MANSKDSNSRVFKIWIIASWYFSNISVLFLNKYLLTNYGFKRPIFLTMCHTMTACSLLSCVAIMWMKTVPMLKLRSVLEDGRTMGRVLHLGGYRCNTCRSPSPRRSARPRLSSPRCPLVGRTEPYLLGFIFCVVATAARAFKSVLQRTLLSTEWNE